MKNKLRNKKGYINEDSIVAIVIILIVVGVIGFGIFRFFYSTTVGNKKAIDMNYTFKKAIVYVGNEGLELAIKRWNDYDGEQIQIETEDGKVYLVSSLNTVLISE